MKYTLEQLITKEKKNRIESGMFGITACKESILFDVEVLHKDLYLLLSEFVKRANEDIFFNKAMVLACWELINEQ